MADYLSSPRKKPPAASAEDIEPISASPRVAALTDTRVRPGASYSPAQASTILSQSEAASTTPKRVAPNQAASISQRQQAGYDRVTQRPRLGNISGAAAARLAHRALVEQDNAGQDPRITADGVNNLMGQAAAGYNPTGNAPALSYVSQNANELQALKRGMSTDEAKMADLTLANAQARNDAISAQTRAMEQGAITDRIGALGTAAGAVLDPISRGFQAFQESKSRRHAADQDRAGRENVAKTGADAQRDVAQAQIDAQLLSGASRGADPKAQAKLYDSRIGDLTKSMEETSKALSTGRMLDEAGRETIMNDEQRAAMQRRHESQAEMVRTFNVERAKLDPSNAMVLTDNMLKSWGKTEWDMFDPNHTGVYLKGNDLVAWGIHPKTGAWDLRIVSN